MAGDGMALHRRLNTSRLARWIEAGLAGFILPVIISPLLISSAYADSLKRPAWTEQAMFHFGNDSFFVGRSSCDKTSEEGRQHAFRHGVQEILNYAQIRDTSGLYVDTQMIFEETDSPGCPHNTVTVWRLLRVETGRLAQLLAASRQSQTGEHGKPVSMPQRPALSIGMSREEIFARFGLPASITMHQSNGFTWEYRRFGLAVEFDRHILVKGWHIPGARTLELQHRSTTQSFQIPSDAPIVDLTPRLGDLEQMGQNSPYVASTVYNQAVFAQRPMPRYVERSPLPTDIVASSSNKSPQPDAISDKVSGLWTCRGEDGGPGQGAFMQTKRGIVISPACTSPWGR
jgi:hypothetical protein